MDSQATNSSQGLWAGNLPSEYVALNLIWVGFLGVCFEVGV